jgi:hypothetical protein
MVYVSRPVVPMTLAIPVPLLLAIWVYNSRPVFPVKLAIVIPDLVPHVLKGTSGLEER